MSLAIYLQYKEKRLLFINGETHWGEGLCYGKDCTLNPPIFHHLPDMTPVIKVWRQPYLCLFENGIIAWRGCHEHIADKLLESMLFLGEETLTAIMFKQQWGPVLQTKEHSVWSSWGAGSLALDIIHGPHTTNCSFTSLISHLSDSYLGLWLNPHLQVSPMDPFSIPWSFDSFLL